MFTVTKKTQQRKVKRGERMTSIYSSVVQQELQSMVRDYCKQRNYKCSGCMYSIKKHYKKLTGEDYKGKIATCIFANCPCDWEVEE